MTTRRSFIATAAVVASSLGSGKVLGQPTPELPKDAEFLFVQSARGMTFNESTRTLTLTGVSPITVFFTDRPERIAGNMKTTSFIPFWSEGKDSFEANPPNADVSVLEGATLRQIVVELRDPVLEGSSLSYTVKILRGTMPAEAEDVAVFIDIIGRPLTPVSYAGAARRRYRRVHWYR